MEEEKLYQFALANVRGIGSANIKSIISYCGSAKNAFFTNVNKLAKIPGIGAVRAHEIKLKPDLEAAQAEFDRAKKAKAEMLFYTDDNYPNRLKQVYDAPPVLYTTSTNHLEASKMVAIVGARKATDYGRGIVTEIIQGLKKHNTTIISGLAYGIDIQAHKQALINGLPTIGVMASGLDIIYPATHRKVANDMRDHGALVTENKFGTKPDAPRFPARNRIIAGMADAVIVVEAARKGGALITAEIANSYDRDVFAIPGNAGSMSSEGCNHLIKANKAHLLDKIEDIEYIMNWDAHNNAKKVIPPIPRPELSEQELAILSLFSNPNSELLIDDISWKSQLNISKVSSLLLQLEFKGLIKSMPGKKFKLISWF